MGRVVNGQSYRDRVKSSLKVEQQLGSQAQNARRPSASGEAAPAGGGSSPLQKRCFVPSTPSPMMRPSSFPEQGGGQVPNFSLGGSMLPPGYGEVAFGELGFGDVGFGDVSTPGCDGQLDQQAPAQAQSMLAVKQYTAEAPGYLSVAKGDAVEVICGSSAPGDSGCAWPAYVYGRKMSGGAVAESPLCGWLPAQVVWELYMSQGGLKWALDPRTGVWAWEHEVSA
eukprot:gnl/TRDRNA2_/TRDRNA2_171709_c0_seq9.p1 gnl/TRDRNA2_/TRDRNA2_171709_c0~~gnl/TRDRNA2_/TRDRNA2_171709_c0_seq9.p1  ORF type:complete len:243 (-),score=37.06 gnl/TRDRNA2_/TRDRNA2_171709_c0_seq9:28-702(-)